MLSLHVLIWVGSPRQAGARCRVLCSRTNKGQALKRVRSRWFSWGLSPAQAVSAGTASQKNKMQKEIPHVQGWCRRGEDGKGDPGEVLEHRVDSTSCFLPFCQSSAFLVGHRGLSPWSTREPRSAGSSAPGAGPLCQTWLPASGRLDSALRLPPRL